MKVAIIGKGVWGTALASILHENKIQTICIGRGKSIGRFDVYILAVPSSAIREVLSRIPKDTTPIIVNTAKGIEKDTHLLPFEIVREMLGKSSYCTLMGPSFSKDVMEKMPTLVNIGSHDRNAALKVKRLFQTDWFRIRFDSSVEAMELAGAMKNVYAIACGISEGLGFGMNTRTKLMLIAYEEIVVLARKLGYSLHSDANPSLMGDLILTCGSMESRNFLFGKLLAEYSVEEALEKINSTVEGYSSLDSIGAITKKARVHLPLAEFVASALLASSNGVLKQKFRDFVRKV